MAKILFAEDTADLNRAVTVVLEHEGYEVASFSDGALAAAALANDVFDLVILDIMMPGKSGLDVLREMRASGDVTPVILLTAKAEVDDRVEGLEAGADDYLPKPIAMKELIARVKSLARRNTDYGTGNLAFADFILDSSTFELKAQNGVRLSHAEFQLLRTFVLNPGRALSVDFLLGRAFAEDDEADASTVDLYVRYLNNKLQAISSAACLEQATNGYLLHDGFAPKEAAASGGGPA